MVGFETTSFSFMQQVLSHAVRLQGFLVIRGSQHVRIPLLFVCDKFFFSSNHIAGFFDEQQYRKERINIYNLMHGDKHKGKEASNTTTLAWFWLGVPLLQLYLRVPLSSISLDGFNSYLFLTMVILSFFLFSNIF